MKLLPLIIAVPIISITTYLILHNTDPDQDKCYLESNTAEIAGCLGDVIDHWKSEMKRELASSDEDAKEAQQFWLSYKQKQIDIINKQYSGSGTATIYERLVPIITIYKNRVYDLRSL